MAGRVHLGTEGEAAAADVLAAWEVGSGFECCAVVSEYPAALAELKARLQEKSERLYTLEPDARFREDGLHALAAKLAMAKTRAVVWLEQDPFDEAGWRSALSALNQDRSWLRSQCPALFVLAGPPALFDLAEVNAPDLWSIVSPKRTLKEAPAWTTAGGRLRWLHLSDLHFKETERWDRRATLQALLRKMEELKRQELSVPKPKDPSRDPHVARSEDSAAVGRWRRIHRGPASLDVFDVLMARVTAVDDPTSRAGTRPSPGRPSSSIWTVWVPISGTKSSTGTGAGCPWAMPGFESSRAGPGPCY